MNPEVIRATLPPLAYLFSSSLFIYGLKRLGRVKTARGGNAIAAVAMLLAVLGTLLELGFIDYRWILAGVVLGGVIGGVAALRVEMTSMPEMVAIFNGFGGAASSLVALSVFYSRVVEAGEAGTAWAALGPAESVTTALSVLIGGVTFTGSVVAFLKLQGKLFKGKPLMLPGRHVLNALLVLGAVAATVAFSGVLSGQELVYSVLGLTAVSLLLGVLLVIPIGGADMPVVVSLLNSYSGLAASAAGFVIGNPALIIAGAMVGAAGLILTNIMCKAMNRSLVAVLLGGFGQDAGQAQEDSEYVGVTSSGPEEAALVLEGARDVIIVPGYGLAVAQAQHAVKELAGELQKRGAQVRYCIHPVAGRMPGHMNVLLAEADVPYEELFELDVINSDFANADVAIVLGANDVANPAAIDDEKSPIYGMPICNVHDAGTVFVVKRSLSPGYAGIKNPLFERPNASMLFGDAKKMMQDILKELREL